MPLLVNGRLLPLDSRRPWTAALSGDIGYSAGTLVLLDLPKRTSCAKHYAGSAGARSKVKPVPDFTINLARVDVVCPAESIACVQQVAGIRDVDRICGNGHLLPECLADRQIERGVRRQVRGTIAIQKAGAELVRGRRPRVARQAQCEDGSYRVPLIVIEEEVTGGSKFE